jgi:hypothetical protein
MKDNQDLSTSLKRHLEDRCLYQYRLYEYILSRLDIIEGLQRDAQTQALAQIQLARVRLLKGRNLISSETYQLYLPADNRARVSAPARRPPRLKNNQARGPPSAAPSTTPGDRSKKAKTKTFGSKPWK